MSDIAKEIVLNLAYRCRQARHILRRVQKEVYEKKVCSEEHYHQAFTSWIECWNAYIASKQIYIDRKEGK